MCGWVVLIEIGRKKSKNVGVNEEKQDNFHSGQMVCLQVIRKTWNE
jgi:hypothetical protein